MGLNSGKCYMNGGIKGQRFQITHSSIQFFLYFYLQTFCMTSDSELCAGDADDH